MKVISWNILHGQPIPVPDPWMELDRSRELLHSGASLLAGAIAGDTFFIGLQEVDVNQPRSASLHQAREIAESTGATHWAFAPAIFGTPGEPWSTAKGRPISIFTHETSEADLLAAGPMYGVGIATNIPVTRWSRCELGKSPVGVRMKFPDGKGGFNSFHIKDENRVALAAELENGYTIVVTHLSFVPVINLLQFWKILLWSKRLPGKVIITGDFNLPWNLPARLSLHKSLKSELTFPIWGVKVQIDYILVPRLRRWAKDIAQHVKANPWSTPTLGLSDHLPHGVDIR